MTDNPDWTAIFNEVFAAEPSNIEAEIWKTSFGDEYPAEVQPYSYITRSELTRFVDELRLDDHSMFLDVGCGRAGPGLWVAAATGATLIGVDIADAALRRARERAEQLGLADRAQFALGSFDSIPVPAGSARAVMSVDALLFAPDKRSALTEVFRVLQAGGRFVATTWDYHSTPPGRAPQVADHRPLLIETGFDVLVYEETENWRTFMERTDELMHERARDLAQEAGLDETEFRKGLQRASDAMATMIRRVLIVAGKPTS